MFFEGWIRIRFLLEGWIRIRVNCPRIRNPMIWSTWWRAGSTPPPAGQSSVPGREPARAIISLRENKCYFVKYHGYDGFLFAHQ